MKNILYLLFFLPLFKFNSCAKENILCHKSISIHNASKNAVYLKPNSGYWTSDSIKSSGEFGDEEEKYRFSPNYKKNLLSPRNECWEHIFIDKYELDRGLLEFLVFNEQGEFMETISFSLSNLRANDFKITYTTKDE